MTIEENRDGRRVVANICLSLDGRINGIGGDYDMSWIVPHAVSEAARDHMVRVTSPATTALLGRKNYQGFGSFWPAVADNAEAAPQDRAFSTWLNATEKVVFSSSLTDAPWANSRIVDGDPADEVRRLRGQPGGDIVALASVSIIRALLAADEVDQLSITLSGSTDATPAGRSGRHGPRAAPGCLSPPHRDQRCSPPGPVGSAR